jgi:hypothetical protein
MQVMDGTKAQAGRSDRRAITDEGERRRDDDSTHETSDRISFRAMAHCHAIATLTFATLLAGPVYFAYCEIIKYAE